MTCKNLPCGRGLAPDGCLAANRYASYPTAMKGIGIYIAGENEVVVVS